MPKMPTRTRMATLVTSRMLFLHLPKTGGSWVTSALLAAGVRAERPASLPFHANREESRAYGDRFTCAFVRHPLDFWRSYWAFRMRDGWDRQSAIDVQAASSDLNEFAARLVERAPGAATHFYEAFVGVPGDEIDFIGRQENLAGDLVSALRSAGEPFDEETLRAHPRVNSSDYALLPTLFTRVAAERLAEAEHVLIERFYASDPLPARLLDRGERGPARGRRPPRPTVAGRLASERRLQRP
jgi:hypothetical protein